MRINPLIFVAGLALTAFSISVSGVFRNDTSETVYVRVLSADETKYEEVVVPPHSVAKNAFADNAPLALFSANGKRLAHLAARPRDITRKYFDRRNSAFYYRITTTGIQLVFPVEGRTWK
jgi:hypothetical protein